MIKYAIHSEAIRILKIHAPNYTAAIFKKAEIRYDIRRY